MTNTTTTETKTLSPVARAARDVRAALKTAFPRVKFTVHSETFSMGNAVRIKWTDGPTSKAVNAVVDRFSYSDFDGMTDSTSYRADRSDAPNRAKYVTCHREISSAIKTSVRANIEAMLSGSAPRWDDCTHQALSRADLTGGYLGVLVIDGRFEVVTG